MLIELIEITKCIWWGVAIGIVCGAVYYNVKRLKGEYEFRTDKT